MRRLFRWTVLAVATYAVLWINTEPVLLLAVVLAAGALYLWTFKLPVGSQVAAVGLAASVVACWWIFYGRLTPFPAIWEFSVGEQPDSTAADIFSAAWWTSVLVVALLLVIHGTLFPSALAARGLAVWTWFGVSLWAADRGDQDGLWALFVVVLAPVAVAMLLASNLAALARAEHGGRARRPEDDTGVKPGSSAHSHFPLRSEEPRKVPQRRLATAVRRSLSRRYGVVTLEGFGQPVRPTCVQLLRT